MLLKRFPNLYRFKMLILISEIGSMLMLTEQELIYWYSVVHAYLSQIQNIEKEKFLVPDFIGENGLPLWSEARVNILLTLCGMYTKKELMRLQSLHF
jgi:hypothetical protein